MSATQRRQIRQRQRRAQVAQLSLTSLMDIFTILVFFLLVSAQNPVKLPDMAGLKLPISNTGQGADNALGLVVQSGQIFLDDRRIMDLPSGPDADYQPLVNAMTALQGRYPARQVINGVPQRHVTLMADQQLPFATLQQIMQSCGNAGFAQIAFAVLPEKRHG